MIFSVGLGITKFGFFIRLKKNSYKILYHNIFYFFKEIIYNINREVPKLPHNE